MLVLSRKKDEDIVIKTPEGRVITIKVVDIINDRVRLDFTAADAVVISRKELLTQEEQHGLERPAPGGPLHTS